MSDVEFGGYWSEKDKQIWLTTDWKARRYDSLFLEDETIESEAYFYGMEGFFTHKITFVKVIGANPIYPPSELLSMIKGYVPPCYDGRDYNNYKLMDRYETQELHDILSR